MTCKELDNEKPNEYILSFLKSIEKNSDLVNYPPSTPHDRYARQTHTKGCHGKGDGGGPGHTRCHSRAG